jgi:hypothetical protein
MSTPGRTLPWLEVRNAETTRKCSLFNFAVGAEHLCPKWKHIP